MACLERNDKKEAENWFGVQKMAHATFFQALHALNELLRFIPLFNLLGKTGVLFDISLNLQLWVLKFRLFPAAGALLEIKGLQ